MTTGTTGNRLVKYDVDGHSISTCAKCGGATFDLACSKCDNAHIQALTTELTDAQRLMAKWLQHDPLKCQCDYCTKAVAEAARIKRMGL